MIGGLISIEIMMIHIEFITKEKLMMMVVITGNENNTKKMR